MEMETTRFGRVNVDPEAVITAPRGLIGFPEATRFVLLEHAPGQPFHWLQCVDDGALAFLVVDPYTFFPDYEFEISDEMASSLAISDPRDVRLLTTVSVRRSSNEVTTNLLGPVVVGISSRQAAQLVLPGDRYTTRHALVPAVPAGARMQAELQPAA